MKTIIRSGSFGKFASAGQRSTLYVDGKPVGECSDLRFATLDMEAGEPGEIHVRDHTAGHTMKFEIGGGNDVDRAYYQAQIRALLAGPQGPPRKPKFKRIAVAVAAAYPNMKGSTK